MGSSEVCATAAPEKVSPASSGRRMIERGRRFIARRGGNGHLRQRKIFRCDRYSACARRCGNPKNGETRCGGDAEGSGVRRASPLSHRAPCAAFPELGFSQHSRAFGVSVWKGFPRTSILRFERGYGTRARAVFRYFTSVVLRNERNVVLTAERSVKVAVDFSPRIGREWFFVAERRLSDSMTALALDSFVATRRTLSTATVD